MDSQHASVKMHDANDELVAIIEQLRAAREELNAQILAETQEKEQLQRDLALLADELNIINGSLVNGTQTRNDYDRTIQETEAAYMKILESTQTLTHVLKREGNTLERQTSQVRASRQ